MSATQDEAKEKAAQAAEQAKEKAGEAAGQAKGRVREQVDQRSTQAGEQVTTQAKDIRAVADSLREQGKDQPAKLAEQAADRAERLGDYLSGSDADRILADLEDFGRKQPMAVVAGGLLLGFAASRFLKASSEKRYEQARSAPARPSLPRTTEAPGVGTAQPTTRPSTPHPAPSSPAPTAHPVGGVSDSGTLAGGV